MSFSTLQKGRAQRHQSFLESSSTAASEDRGLVTAHHPVSSDGVAALTDSRYQQLPLFLEIRSTNSSGRGIWTKSLSDDGTRSIPAGTRLLSIQPHAHALSTMHLSTFCSACHRLRELKRCPKCKVIYYCSEKCQNIDWKIHKSECIALQKWMASSSTSKGAPEVVIPGEAVRALARLLWMQEKKGSDSTWVREVNAMQSNRASIPTSAHEGLTMLSHSLVRYLTGAEATAPGALEKWGLRSARDLLDLLSRFTVNSFTLTDSSLTSIGVAISPLAALINHSCIPNAVVVFPRPSSVFEAGVNPLEVIAIRDISPGEEVLTSYIDISLPRHSRLRELQERYQFECKCQACVQQLEVANVDPRWATFCGIEGCAGLVPIPDPDAKHDKLIRCQRCRVDGLSNLNETLDLIRLGEDALNKASALEISEPNNAFRYTSNMIPLLMRRIPPTAHPLFALSRLHISLLIGQLSGQTDISSEAQGGRLPKVEVDRVCQLSMACLSALTVVFPEGHPVRGIALAELGKLLCVDVEEDASSEDPTAKGSIPGGAERLSMARSILLQAREELQRGFGKGGGEVGRQVDETIRNLEKEWKGWRHVQAQGGLVV